MSAHFLIILSFFVGSSYLTFVNFLTCDNHTRVVSSPVDLVPLIQALQKRGTFTPEMAATIIIGDQAQWDQIRGAPLSEKPLNDDSSLLTYPPGFSVTTILHPYF